MGKKADPIPVLPFHRLIGKALPPAASALVLWAGFLSFFKYLADVTALSPVTTVLRILLAALAAVYLGYPLFKGPGGQRITIQSLKGYFRLDQVLLIALFVWSIFSCISMNQTYGQDWFAYNRYDLWDSTLCLFVLYPLGRYFAKNGMPSVLRWVLFLFALALTLFAGYILVKVCEPSIITLPNGRQIGMSEEIRLSINCNSNTTGIYSALLLSGCALGAFFAKGFRKVVSILMCPIHFFILILSGSRGSYIAAAAFLAGITAAELYSRAKVKNGRTILLTIAAAAATMTAVYFARGLFDVLYESISHLREILGVGGEPSLGGFNLTDLSGRIVIYENSLKAMVQDARSVFMGCSPEGVIPMLEAVSGGEVSGMYTHNQFLEIGMATGFTGLILFCVWEIRQICRSITLFFSREETVTRAMRLVPFAILMSFTANLMEATLLWYGYATAYFFFLLCGWVSGTAEK